MKHVLVGTAGHVDHGKTALIRALTGIETDRLLEEKSRGITIDLGFAHMTLPGGGIASIVDVPGHEKFIKNMLAGAGGIDLVLLVIAADDGVMPQTREHMGILQLLQAKQGIIVLTKCDLADEDWQDMICEDIKQLTADTFLQGTQISRVSSHTGQGMQELKNLIHEKISEASAKNIATPFRIPVDRVFSAEGFGTVITGTLIEGQLHQGDEVTIYPTDDTGRVRTLQVHGQHVETAYAGQRVAVNLSGVRRDEIVRGHVLASEGTIQPTRMLDVKLSAMANGPREIKSGSRLHFHYGTGSSLCKVVLVGVDKLLPGETCYAQLRFAEDVAVKKGDSFVVRFYSPTETVGGGTVLHTAPKKHRKGRTDEAIKAFEALEKGDMASQIHQAIGGIAQLEELRKRFGLDADAWKLEIEALVAENHVTIIGPQVIDDNHREMLLAKTIGELREYHKANPLHQGMRKEELRSRILPGQKPAFFDALLNMYGSHVKVQDSRAYLAGFEITYTPQQQQVRDGILAKLQEAGFTPPSVDELLGKKANQNILDAMLAEGAVISTEPGIVFDARSVQEAKASLQELAAGGDGSVTLAQFRDKVQTSRKYALSLLEYFDRIGFTRKLGDSRVLM